MTNTNTTQIDTGKYTHKGVAQKFFHESLELETNDCIEWKYTILSNGYGQVNFENKKQSVHRLALINKIGEPPIDKPHALHNCHNRVCFNYRHLRWGNRKDNMADKLKDGTTNRGAFNGRSKLTDEVVLAIRKDKRKQIVLAKEYGVSHTTISDIKLGKKWGWL